MGAILQFKMPGKKCARKITPYVCGHEDVDYKHCGGDHADDLGHCEACYRSATLPPGTSQKLPQMPGGCTRDCQAKLTGWKCCKCDKSVNSGLIHEECKDHEVCNDCYVEFWDPEP